MKYGLSESQLNEIIKIISTYKKIDEAVLFGSRAMDTFKEASDVDIAIKEKEADYSLAAKLKTCFEEDTNLLFFFDFVSYESITSPEVKKHIDRYGITIYRKGWREVRLGEVVDVIMGQSPKSETYNENGEGLPFYQGVVDFGYRYVTPRVYCSSPKKVIEPNYLLLSVRAPVGDVNFTRQKCSIGRGNAGLRMRSGERDFLFYLLKFSANQFNSSSSGSIFSSISKSDIENLEVFLPPLPKQKAIAEVLSSLDDTIELLYRQNKTLENMAQTLFRKYFVEDRDEGWEEVSLGNSELSKIMSSGIHKFEGEKTYIATADVQGGKIQGMGTKITYGSRPSRANMQPVDYSVWFAKKGGVRKVLMFDAFSKQSVADTVLSTGFAGLKTTEESHYYIWCFVYSQDFQNVKDSLISGTVQPDVNNGSIMEIKVPKPDINTLVRFNSVVNPIFHKSQTNQSQIRTLESLRDTLLPKLMSGDVIIES